MSLKICKLAQKHFLNAVDINIGMKFSKFIIPADFVIIDLDFNLLQMANNF